MRRWMASMVTVAVAGLPVCAADEAKEPDIETILYRAQGAGLMEVVEVKRVDQRPVDGPLADIVTLKAVRSTGELATELTVVVEQGGMLPFKPPGLAEKRPLIAPGDLVRGRRYWMAFSGWPQWQGWRGRTGGNRGPVLAVWPEAGAGSPDAEMLADLEAAIKADTHAMAPQWVPQLDVVYEHKSPLDAKSWYVRVRKGRAQIVWEAQLPGALSPDGDVRAWPRENVFDLQLVPETKSNFFLWARGRQDLPAGNEYGLPAGVYDVGRWYDIETGRLAAVQVLEAQGPLAEYLFRVLDPKTNRPFLERRNDFRNTGGKAVGAETDAWLHRVVRTFDPATGRQFTEMHYRHGRVKNDEGLEHSGWVPIDAPADAAATAAGGEAPAGPPPAAGR